jgi:hypothetical protein
MRGLKSNFSFLPTYNMIRVISFLPPAPEKLSCYSLVLSVDGKTISLFYLNFNIL